MPGDGVRRQRRPRRPRAHRRSPAVLKGRPAIATVGVDLGGTKCLGVVIVGGEVAGEERVATPTNGEAVLDTIAELTVQLGTEAGESVEAVGVGVPGLVDRDGVLRAAPNLRGAAGLHVRDGLESRLGIRIEVDNDATCAACGEHSRGAARGLSDVVLVTLGTGIGGGIVTGGKVHRGVNRFAGEIGHMVVDAGGPPCSCGRRGCWERFASGSGLGILGRTAALAGRATRIVELAGGDPEAVRGEHVSAALSEGDEEARQVMADFAWWLALGLANLTKVLDPEAFVIGGGLVECGPALFEPAAAAFRGQLEEEGVRRPVEILPAALGLRAGAIGAAFLAEQELREVHARVSPPDR